MVCKLARQRKEGATNCAVFLLHSGPFWKSPWYSWHNLFIPDVDGGEDVCVASNVFFFFLAIERCTKSMCFLVIRCFCRRPKKNSTWAPETMGNLEIPRLPKLWETDPFFEGLCPFPRQQQSHIYTLRPSENRQNASKRERLVFKGADC